MLLESDTIEKAMTAESASLRGDDCCASVVALLMPSRIVDDSSWI